VSAQSQLLARLLEVGDLSTFLSEVARGARLLTHARSTELSLYRNPPPAPGRRPRHRRPLMAAPRRALRRVQDGHSVLSRSAAGVSMLVPIRHGGRTLGCLRLGWFHPPSPMRLASLRRYLAHAGAALARIVAEERLLRQHRRYEALLDSLPDACLLILSPEAVVIGVRGRLHRIAGLDPARLLGQSLAASDLRSGLLRLGRARLRALVASARAAGRAETETWLRAAGQEVQVQMTLVDLGSTGEMVCVLRDLTDVKAMELALVRRNEELTLAAERLKEIDILKNEFMSNVSHELRTPLTAIIAYSEALLLTPPEAETQREFLRVIAEQGHKLQRLIGGLLDIAKLESLATELKLQMSSLNDVVRAAIITVKPTADKNHISISTALEPDLPVVWLDELRAQQIVWNLLANAIKFSPAGSVVHIRTWHDDSAVWAAIRDQGIGIAPEHQQLIFEKFVQLDGSTTRRHGGVGLGLDLVKHLVELHGGAVRVESASGEGSTFVFSIPLEKRRRPRLGDVRRKSAVEMRRAS
jgi:signal transduction histidine kinase